MDCPPWSDTGAQVSTRRRNITALVHLENDQDLTREETAAATVVFPGGAVRGGVTAGIMAAGDATGDD